MDSPGHPPPQYQEPETTLVTSEMMKEGNRPLLFTGGACNIQGPDGAVRNPGRDRLARWLEERGWSYFDPQIHPSTHGRDYVFELDGPQESVARANACLRVYEILPTNIGAISILEVMDDARRGRESVVWFHGGRDFEPNELGERDVLKANDELRRRVGGLVFHHLVAHADAGRQMRCYLTVMLEDCPLITFVDSFEELKYALNARLETKRYPAASAEVASSSYSSSTRSTG